MKIKEGSIVRGKVTGIQSYGAFVQLSEDCNGLIWTVKGWQKIGWFVTGWSCSICDSETGF